MPRIARVVIPGCPHHVTQRGNRRQRTFFDERDYRSYIALLCKLRARFEVDIWAYCLMPNHVHFVAMPRSPDGLARLFGLVHHRYARQINKRCNWQGHLWQERFYSTPMDEAHLLAAVRYVELNPVRSGLCDRPEHWEWSSVRAHLGEVSDPLVDNAPMLRRVSDWRRYLADESGLDLMESLRSCTRTGRPAGSESFIDAAEALTGRQLRRRKPGPDRESWSLSLELSAESLALGCPANALVISGEAVWTPGLRARPSA